MIYDTGDLQDMYDSQKEDSIAERCIGILPQQKFELSRFGEKVRGLKTVKRYRFG